MCVGVSVCVFVHVSACVLLSSVVEQNIFDLCKVSINRIILINFSNLSRNSHSEYEVKYKEGKEHLVNFAEKYLESDNSIDYFVFGHRHIVLNMLLSDKKTKFVNLGDWINHFSYGVFDGNEFEIAYYES